MKSILKMIFTAAVSGILLFALGCNKHKITPMVPFWEPFYLRINANGKFITDSNYLDSLVLYYYDHGRYVANADSMDPSSLTQYDHPSLLQLMEPHLIEGWRKKGVLTSDFLSTLSAYSHIYNFYLRFPDGSVDTLYLEAEQLSNEQGRKDPCYCTAPIRVVKINGKDAPLDTTLSNRVYILYR